MFGLGGKSNVPQSSQYDFKGTTVLLCPILRSSHHQARTNPLPQEQEM